MEKKKVPSPTFPIWKKKGQVHLDFCENHSDGLKHSKNTFWYIFWLCIIKVWCFGILSKNWIGVGGLEDFGVRSQSPKTWNQNRPKMTRFFFALSFGHNFFCFYFFWTKHSLFDAARGVDTAPIFYFLKIPSISHDMAILR